MLSLLHQKHATPVGPDYVLFGKQAKDFLVLQYQALRNVNSQLQVMQVRIRA